MELINYVKLSLMIVSSNTYDYDSFFLEKEYQSLFSVLKASYFRHDSEIARSSY